jgi:uncharacterized repeat protein (TIGR02543 family)
MNLTKKRILSIAAAFAIAGSAATFPARQYIPNPFPAMRVSAAEVVTAGQAAALETLDSVTTVTVTMQGEVPNQTPASIDFGGVTGISYDLTQANINPPSGSGQGPYTITGTVPLTVNGTTLSGSFSVNITYTGPTEVSGSGTYTVGDATFTISSFDFNGTAYTVNVGDVSYSNVTSPVTINLNDGVTGGEAASYDLSTKNITLTDGNPTREGYTFANWTTGSIGGSPYNSATQYTPDTQLYANWTINKNQITLSGTTVPTATGSTTTTIESAVTDVNFGETITLAVAVPTGKVFAGWTVVKTDDPTTIITVTSATTATGATFTMPDYDVTVSYTLTDAAVVTPPPASGDTTVTGGSSSSSSSNSDSSATPPTPNSVPKRTPASETSSSAVSTTTSTTTTTKTTPAANAVADTEISEEGTVGVTVGGVEIETSSTSAAAAITGGTASEVITSGSAVAVVTKDNDVIAGANASGSLNSASTVAALKSAAADITEGETTVTVNAGSDVTAISASTLKKIAETAEEAGVTAVITAEATDKDGTPVATLDIPVTSTAKTSIKTGIILEDKTIDTAIAALEKQTGTKVLASFKTEQKSSFGTKATFTFETKTLGLENIKDGTTVYIAIKRGDGKTVQVTGTVKGGKLTFTSTSAGTFMISDKSFVK